MISSMTGFAREAGAAGTLNWAWELKSVNGRNLDVRVRVPPGFDAVGEEARKQVCAVLARGDSAEAFVWRQADDGPGSLWLKSGYLFGDTDGNGYADLSIRVGDAHLLQTDILF